MTIVMQQTIRDSINGGVTTQTFAKDGRYDVPTAVGQLWIGHGWARAAAARSLELSPGLSGSSGPATKQTKHTKQTGPTREE